MIFIFVDLFLDNVTDTLVSANIASTPEKSIGIDKASTSPITPGSVMNQALSDMDRYCHRRVLKCHQSWLTFFGYSVVIHGKGKKPDTMEVGMAPVNYYNFDSGVHKEQELTLLGNPGHLDPASCIHRREIENNEMKAVLTPRVKVRIMLV